MDNWTKEELKRLQAECMKYGLNNSILASKIAGRNKNGTMSRITISRQFSGLKCNLRVIDEIIQILIKTKSQINNSKKEFLKP